MQVTTIPITIPVTSIVEAPSIDVQSQLWVKGCQPNEEERIVEMELDQEQKRKDHHQRRAPWRKQRGETVGQL